MQLQHVLDKVGLQLRMNLIVSNVHMPFNELQKFNAREKFVH
jgi:hypothetical protein